MKNKNLLILCGIFFAGILASCSTAPDRSFKTTDLLFDQTILLEGWKLMEYPEGFPDEEGQEEESAYIFQNMQTDFNVRTIEKVFRYRSLEWAVWHLNRFQEDYMSNSTPGLFEWETPSEFTFEPEYSKNWKFACESSTNVCKLDTCSTNLSCQYLAQYEEFIVQARFMKEVKGISYLSMTEIENILTAIDQKFGDYLYSDKE